MKPLPARTAGRCCRYEAWTWDDIPLRGRRPLLAVPMFMDKSVVQSIIISLAAEVAFGVILVPWFLSRCARYLKRTSSLILQKVSPDRDRGDLF